MAFLLSYLLQLWEIYVPIVKKAMVSRHKGQNQCLPGKPMNKISSKSLFYYNNCFINPTDFY
jgi:hypothetical protein